MVNMSGLSKCNNCDGNGEISSPFCNENIKCGECNGTGKVHKEIKENPTCNKKDKMVTKIIITMPGATQNQIGLIQKRAVEWLNNPKDDVLVLGGGDPKGNFKVEIFEFDSNTGEIEVINKLGD